MKSYAPLDVAHMGNVPEVSGYFNNPLNIANFQAELSGDVYTCAIGFVPTLESAGRQFMHFKERPGIIAFQGGGDEQPSPKRRPTDSSVLGHAAFYPVKRR